MIKAHSLSLVTTVPKHFAFAKAQQADTDARADAAYQAASHRYCLQVLSEAPLSLNR